MEHLAKEWIDAAFMDLESIKYILEVEHLTPIVAFHSQQAIEKSFKALIFKTNQSIPKTHDLIKLYLILRNKLNNIDELMLERINEIYIESRYPGDLGLLPYGKPTLEDAKEFYTFAKDIFEKIKKDLNAK